MAYHRTRAAALSESKHCLAEPRVETPAMEGSSMCLIDHDIASTYGVRCICNGVGRASNFYVHLKQKDVSYLRPDW